MTASSHRLGSLRHPVPVRQASAPRRATPDPEISVRRTPVDYQDGGFLPAAPTCVLAKSLADLAKGLA